MSEEAEKAEWRRRQAIKPPKPRVLHESRRCTMVKTDGLPVPRFYVGSTFMGPAAVASRIAARVARQQLRDKQMIERANKSVDEMRSAADAITLGVQATIK